MTILDTSKAALNRVSAATTAVFQWAWANKPFVVAVAIGVQAAMDYAGMKTPAWLYGIDAALGITALHSANKSNAA